MKSEVLKVDASIVGYSYDAQALPRAEVQAGTSLSIETLDARNGTLLDRRLGIPYELPPPPEEFGNPVTGPVCIEGIEPGDVIAVDIRSIYLDETGWCGAHAHVGPTRPGIVAESVGRTCSVGNAGFNFEPSVFVRTRPMIGCIGIAPPGRPVSSGLAGQHGGNLDQPVITTGSRVYLPAFVKHGLLFVGDVHAAQGDGELSGVALEIGATVELWVDRASGVGPLSWPWVETETRLMVLTTGKTFEAARADAVENMIRAIQSAFALRANDALSLLSLVGDLRIGQAYGGPFVSLRLEVPIELGVVPVA